MAVKDRFKGVPKAEQRGKRWSADYTTKAGKRITERFDTKEAAETWHSKRLAEKRAGVTVDFKEGQRTTVSMLWPEFRERLLAGGARGGSPSSPKTMSSYDAIYKNYIAPKWGTAPLGNIHYNDVEDWISTLQGVTGGPASPSLRQEVAKKFRTLMDHAVRKQYIQYNPAKDAVGRADYIPRPKTAKEHVYLTMAQLRALADNCDGYTDMILTAGLCGLRFGEVTALQVQDVQLGRQPQLRVCRAYSDVRGTVTLGTTKTGVERSVPLPKALADMLALRIADRPAEARVWDAPNGGFIRHGSFTKAGSRFAKAKGAAIAAAPVDDPFPNLTFHDLRHTAVSLHISAGSNVKVVQEIAGHQDATVTLNTYAGLFDADKHDSAARINKVFEALARKA
ncbi:hypothetical protein AOZ07_03355 [Glutamicibacter halophytocola]|uniref:tyrosine-type recombinase/integrase n=1 Tax=Glutamicibacter halophytocola TaxID=1933880 RepID=UPI0006D4A08F|nr:site-specific integrase [Glutamicibacter halophytocola]ALG28126.1 hypothetical protein AOZ07_03355 [Glutamicibacter halophytocola]